MDKPPFKPKVFISHSAKDSAAKQVLDAFVHALKGEDFEVLVDKALQPGDKWRAIIDEWIWRCDAAILLLSKDAVTSKYVYYEATLLRQRWLSCRSSFVLIPILVAGVTAKLLEKEMGPLQLSEIQWIPIPSRHSKVDNPPPAILEAVLSRLRVVMEVGPPRNQLEERLRDILHLRCVTDEALQEIADLIPVDRVPPAAKRDRAKLVSRALLEHQAIKLGEDRFRRLGSVVDKLRVSLLGGDEETRKVINIVTPFCWVDPKAAAELGCIASKEPGPRGVAWRRSWRLSERMYYARAFCNTAVRVVEVDPSSGALHEILDHVRTGLARECGYGVLRNDQDLNKHIAKLESRGEPVFVVLEASYVDDAVLSAILRNWPKIRLFLYQLDLTRKQFDEWKFSDVKFLEPPLDPGLEDDASFNWGYLMTRAGADRKAVEKGEAFERSL